MAAPDQNTTGSAAPAGIMPPGRPLGLQTQKASISGCSGLWEGLLAVLARHPMAMADAGARVIHRRPQHLPHRRGRAQDHLCLTVDTSIHEPYSHLVSSALCMGPTLFNRQS